MEHASGTRSTGSTRVGEPRPVVAYSLALLAVATGLGVVLFAAGEPLPTLGPVLLLAVAAALCVNRFALFPTEHASTAEAAVLLAAVVGFRADAAVLGPLVVALLVGPLDALHWEQRSFVRMAHNAGNRGLATLAAVGAFDVCHTALGSSTVDWCLVVAVAGGVFVLVDLLLSVSLLRLLGEPLRDAFGHLFEVDALTLPIAWYGAAVALLLGGVGWWAIALALVPVAFVPELVIARAHRDTAVARDVAALMVVTALLATLALVFAVPNATTFASCVVLGVLTGVELVLDRRLLLPPLVALATVAACVAVEPAHVEFAAALVATASVTASWCTTARASRPRLLAVGAMALATALGAAQLVLAAPRTVTGVSLGALAAGLAFEAVGVATSRDRRRTGVVALWTVPLLTTAVVWAWVWRTGHWAAFVVAMTATLALVAGWGAPPWRSRFLGAARRRIPARALVPIAIGLAVAAVVTAAFGAVWLPIGLAESLTAMATIGVRQWRFAPRPRAFSLAALLAVGAALLFAGPVLLRDHPQLGVALVIGTLTVVGVTARQPAARARVASPR